MKRKAASAGRRSAWVLGAAGLALALCFAGTAWAGPTEEAVAGVLKQDYSPALRNFVVLTMMSLIPILMIGMTAFTRIVIVLSLLRHALGLPQTPPNSVIVTLAACLTWFTMAPVAEHVHRDAIAPYMQEKITATQAIELGGKPLRDFMVSQTREADLRVVVEMARVPPPKTVGEIRFSHLVPAFLLSELRTAFQIGFVIFLPFLLVDLVVSAVLMALGMIMLPPTTISLPLKILLFVLIDGWVLLSKALLSSYWS
ncbi:MAG TPA: flagellar type III secretion system pore protein FliP [Lysobacter sp.]